jgi:hypothetical protein
MAEVKHLPLRKYLRLRDTHGHTKAVEMMTRQENEEIFNLIVRCHTPDNMCIETGVVRIREDA